MYFFHLLVSSTVNSIVKIHTRNVFLLGDYVTCKSCRKRDTLMGKSKRLTVVKCQSCQSEYAVQAIRSGFQAQVGRRSANVK